METLKDLFKQRRNLIGLIIVLILLVGLPVGLYLAGHRQIFRPKAAETGTFQLTVNPMQFTVPAPVTYSAYAQLTGFDNNGQPTSNGISRIEIKTALRDPNTNTISAGPFTFGSYNCGGSSYGVPSVCNYPPSIDQYNTGDAGDWVVYMNVYDENGGLYCSGDPGAENTPYDCGGGSFAFVHASAGGGGGTEQINITYNLGENCTSYGSQSFRSVTLSWNNIAGASGYEVTSGNISLGTVNSTTYSYSELVGSRVQFSVTALGGSNATGSIDVPISACTGGGGESPTPTPQTGSGTLTVSGNQVGTQCTNNQGAVSLNVKYINGYVYLLYRDNVLIYSSSALSGNIMTLYDNNVPAGAHTYLVTASNGSQQLQGSVPITVNCNGQGGTTGGYLYGTCQNGVCIGTNTPTYGSISYSQCVATCGNGGGVTGGTCNATPVCSGSCTGIANTCNNGNGTQSGCNYTTLNGSTSCTQSPAPNQVCNAGNLCQAGNTCSGGQCVTPQQPTNPPANTPVPTATTAPYSGGPSFVKLANGPDNFSGDFQSACSNVLASGSSEVRSLDGLTSKDFSYNLNNSTPATKLVCAVFLDNNQTQVGAVFWNQIQLVNTNPSPTPTPTPPPNSTPTPTPTPPPSPTTSASCTPSHGDALINGHRDGIVDLLDFNEWRDEFLYELNHGHGTSSGGANFDCLDGVDLLDFNVWRDAFKATLGL